MLVKDQLDQWWTILTCAFQLGWDFKNHPIFFFVFPHKVHFFLLFAFSQGQVNLPNPKPPIGALVSDLEVLRQHPGSLRQANGRWELIDWSTFVTDDDWWFDSLIFALLYLILCWQEWSICMNSIHHPSKMRSTYMYYNHILYCMHLYVYIDIVSRLAICVRSWCLRYVGRSRS